VGPEFSNAFQLVVGQKERALREIVFAMANIGRLRGWAAGALVGFRVLKIKRTHMLLQGA
jgi:hypothetical protein